MARCGYYRENSRVSGGKCLTYANDEKHLVFSRTLTKNIESLADLSQTFFERIPQQYRITLAITNPIFYQTCLEGGGTRNQNGVCEQYRRDLPRDPSLGGCAFPIVEKMCLEVRPSPRGCVMLSSCVIAS